MAGKYYDQIVEYILANQEKFYRLAYSYIKNPDGAMDAVQNAICRALEKYRTLRDIKAVKTWFYRILVNECLMYLRKHDKEIPVDSDSWEGWNNGIYIESAFEPGEEVFKKLDRLNPEVRTVIILYYFEELTLKEIADVTQTNLNTVKSRMYSGLRKLKGIIKEDSD
ncbi:MAG: RNA polymerase sigma factor [Lachnospiraceae bacterium]|nr:RNA polymerase sigma factor [Lachnospiraceae bacterium]